MADASRHARAAQQGIGNSGQSQVAGPICALRERERERQRDRERDREVDKYLESSCYTGIFRRMITFDFQAE